MAFESGGEKAVLLGLDRLIVRTAAWWRLSAVTRRVVVPGDALWFQRHAHQLRDDRAGDLTREVPYGIDLAALVRLVEQLVDHFEDARAHGFGRTGGEAMGGGPVAGGRARAGRR